MDGYSLDLSRDLIRIYILLTAERIYSEEGASDKSLTALNAFVKGTERIAADYYLVGTSESVSTEK